MGKWRWQCEVPTCRQRTIHWHADCYNTPGTQSPEAAHKIIKPNEACFTCSQRCYITSPEKRGTHKDNHFECRNCKEYIVWKGFLLGTKARAPRKTTTAEDSHYLRGGYVLDLNKK